MPVLDVPGVPGLGRVVLEAADLIAPYRRIHQARIQGDDHNLIGKDPLAFLDELAPDLILS